MHVCFLFLLFLLLLIFVVVISLCHVHGAQMALIERSNFTSKSEHAYSPTGRGYSLLFSSSCSFCLYSLSCQSLSSGYVWNKRHVCMKPHRPPMTNTHALLGGTETAFWQAHASERPFSCIFKNVNISWGQRSVDAITGSHRPQKKHSLMSEFMPELHRWVLKLSVGHLQILHQEILWSTW